jgi:hypothetical protein
MFPCQAISHAEAIGRNVRQQLGSAQTLAQACIQAASLSYDSRTQTNLFEQCKTVLEASIQLMFATKDSGTFSAMCKFLNSITHSLFFID